MSTKEKKLAKIASGCRSLADDLEAGIGPKLRKGTCFDALAAPACAIGHAFWRAGFNPDKNEVAKNAAGFVNNWEVAKNFLGEPAHGVHLFGTGTFDHTANPLLDKALTRVQEANDLSTTHEERAEKCPLPLRALAEAIDQHLSKQLPNLESR